MSVNAKKRGGILQAPVQRVCLLQGRPCRIFCEKKQLLRAARSFCSVIRVTLPLGIPAVARQFIVLFAAKTSGFRHRGAEIDVPLNPRAFFFFFFFFFLVCLFDWLFARSWSALKFGPRCMAPLVFRAVWAPFVRFLLVPSHHRSCSLSAHRCSLFDIGIDDAGRLRSSSGRHTRRAVECFAGFVRIQERCARFYSPVVLRDA